MLYIVINTLFALMFSIVNIARRKLCCSDDVFLAGAPVPTAIGGEGNMFGLPPSTA
jgi:hypothetical protein